jgi:hypothetical protein
MSGAPSAWTAVATILISTLTTSVGSVQLAPACVENSPGRRGERGCSISVVSAHHAFGSENVTPQASRTLERARKQISQCAGRSGSL